MLLHPQNLPEKVLGTSSIPIVVKFDALFSANFQEMIFVRCSSRVSFFVVEERREEKVASGCVRVGKNCYSVLCWRYCSEA